MNNDLPELKLPSIDSGAFAQAPEIVPCTSCGSEEYLPRGSYGPWGLRRCKKCYLLYVSPRPTEADIERIYSESYFEGTGSYGNRGTPGGYMANEAGYIGRAQVLVPWILGRIGLRQGNWLDVGCGPGYLMEVAQEHGFKCVGIDVSKAAVEWARVRSLEAFATPAERLTEVLGERRFEVISLVDTLFHLRYPGRVLEKLSQRLVPGGWLFAGPFDLTTREQIEAVVTNPDPDQLGVPEHLSFVNQVSMKFLLEQFLQNIVFAPIPLTPADLASKVGAGPGAIGFGRKLLRAFPWLRRHTHRIAFNVHNARAGYVFARRPGLSL